MKSPAAKIEQLLQRFKQLCVFIEAEIEQMRPGNEETALFYSEQLEEIAEAVESFHRELQHDKFCTELQNFSEERRR